MLASIEPIAWLARRDGTAVIGHGPFEERATPPPATTAFFRQDFALNDPKPWKIPASTRVIPAAGLPALFPSCQLPAISWQSPDASQFSEVFQEALNSIQAGIFEKSVPVVTEAGSANSNPGPAIAAAMTRKSAPLHSYGWIENGCGFAGATPELLVSLNGRHLETMALAGTARSEDQDVFAVDEKEIREHEYVAQTLVSKLLDLGKLHRHSREILDLGQLVHFLTSFHLDLDEPADPAKLVRRLHPTPALGPLPRTHGTLEQLLRWRQRLLCPTEFGAPFGVSQNNRFEAIVAIRGIWWSGNRLSIPAGCGLIEASRLVNEWRELRLKREAVKHCLRS